MSWEEWCLDVLERVYGERFQHVPAERRGDLGIDGFLDDGSVYQCYAPLEPLSVIDRYEKQRDKLTRELRKLAKNLGEVEEVLGRPLETYVMLVPRFDGPELMVHATAKANWLREQPSLSISPSFNIRVFDRRRLERRLRAQGLGLLSEDAALTPDTFVVREQPGTRGKTRENTGARGRLFSPVPGCSRHSGPQKDRRKVA
ncbi:MAG: hypothetical protein ACHQHO_10690, partial [Solirubrobacterales bacterium]